MPACESVHHRLCSLRTGRDEGARNWFGRAEVGDGVGARLGTGLREDDWDTDRVA